MNSMHREPVRYKNERRKRKTESIENDYAKSEVETKRERENDQQQKNLQFSA